MVAPCPPNTSYTWVTQTKQSNDFSGTGNGFTRVGPDPSVTVTVGCPDHVAFGQQPTGTIAGQPINAGSSPAGVTVRVEDAIGQLVTNSTAAVSVSIASGPGTLFGTTSANAGRGGHVLDLAIDLAGTYTLLAQSAPLTSATSNSFVITGVAGKCDQTPCGTATGCTPPPMTLPSGRSACRWDVPGSLLRLARRGTGTFCEGACTGNTIIFAPPPNQDDVATLTIEMFKTLFSGNWTTFGSSSWPTMGLP